MTCDLVPNHSLGEGLIKLTNTAEENTITLCIFTISLINYLSLICLSVGGSVYLQIHLYDGTTTPLFSKLGYQVLKYLPFSETKGDSAFLPDLSAKTMGQLTTIGAFNSVASCKKAAFS